MNTVTIFEESLSQARENNMYRSLNVLSPSSGTATHRQWNGNEYILFCSNDYLGLSAHPRVVQAAQCALEKYGVGSGASRLISGTTDWHHRLEEKIAHFKNKEAALVFSSGYHANVGIITALADKNTLLVIDKLSHASIIDACKLSEATLRIYPHNNMKKLEALLQHASDYERTLIVTDSVFSMDGDCALLKKIIALKEQYGAMLMIDEAHATGVFGERGSGLAEALGCEDQVDIIMGTLSKAVGGLGGYCATSRVIVDYLINKSRSFIYTTSLPAVLCAAAYEAITIIEEGKQLREQLWKNTEEIKKAIEKRGYRIGQTATPIIPIIIGDTDKTLSLAQKLFDQHIYIPAVRPPTVPKGEARLRLTVSAAHTATDVEQLLKRL